MSDTDHELEKHLAVGEALKKGLKVISDLMTKIKEQQTTIDAQAAEIERLTHINASMELSDHKQDLADASAHVIIEHGIIPGGDHSCRCEACKMVAVAMDNAGYLDNIRDRWWVDCDHKWKDARNTVVESGEICLKCGAMRPGNEPDAKGTE